jgi:chromosome segregation ATPase
MEKMMPTKNKITLAVLATTLTLSSVSVMAQSRDHNRANDKKEFRVCAPYRADVIGFSNNLANFQDEVIAPLARELSTQSSKVDQRVREERKLESAVRGINSDITISERRLQSIPSLIIANTNLVVAKKTEIINLNNDIVRYEAELADAGWIRRGTLKRKIKGAKKDIKKAEKKISSAIQNNASMEEESRNIPARIISLRNRLTQADASLAAHRQLQPSLDSMRDVERTLRNRLDSQEDVRSEITMKLSRAERRFKRCQKIDSDAQVYSHLAVMADRLQKSQCDLEAVTRRLPYDVSKAERRALSEANGMVCDPLAPTINTNVNQ